MKLGTETGSLINHLMAGQKEAKVGDPATILFWSDRKPGTVIKVTKAQIHVQRDNYKRVGTFVPGGPQEYTYERDPNGIISVFRKTKRGWKDSSGCGLCIGHREAYYDMTF